jgi:hypothetical protein
MNCARERCGVEPQDLARTKRDDEHAGDCRPDEGCDERRRLIERVGPLNADAGLAGEIGQHGHARE